MNNAKFSFVVLHYLSLNDTIECVDSILKNIDYENYYIVVVDNGSPDNSGKVLKEKYETHSKVKVILNKKNLGFAKGNNIGFNFAKKELKSDFIALINNDTIIEQKDFIRKILDEFNRSNFHILGPDIISLKDGGHQNPRDLTLQNYDELQAMIKQYKIKLFLNYFFADKILENLKKRFLRKPLIKQTITKAGTWKERAEGVKLHGSALIFSPLYIKRYDGLYPKTFMYSEEAILYFVAKRDGLITIYSPDVKILHKEDSSTNAVMNYGFKKRRFYYKNFIKSGYALLELMKGEK